MHLPDHNDDQHEYDRGTVRQLPVDVFRNWGKVVCLDQCLHRGVWMLHSSDWHGSPGGGLYGRVRNNHHLNFHKHFDIHNDFWTVRRVLLEMERLRMVSLSV